MLTPLLAALEGLRRPPLLPRAGHIDYNCFSARL